MNALKFKKKIAHLLPKGEESFDEFIKEALLLKLQDVNKKIALFEGKYNRNFLEFVKEWRTRKQTDKFSYEHESDYLDWEALEEYKRDLMRVISTW